VIASEAFKAELERAIAELKPPAPLEYDPETAGQAIGQLFKRAIPTMAGWQDPRKQEPSPPSA
jgi:hypothetical protein